MSAGFDWKPLLSDGEVVVWEGRPSRLKIFVGSAVVTAVVIVAWLTAMAEVAQAPGGSECFTDNCPTADGKAGLVIYLFGPLSFLLCGTVMVTSPFLHFASAITSERVLSIRRPILRKQPKLEQISVRGAKAALDGFSFLKTATAFGPHPSVSYRNQRITLWARSTVELKRAVNVIEQLSSEYPPSPGPTP